MIPHCLGIRVGVSPEIASVGFHLSNVLTRVLIILFLTSLLFRRWLIPCSFGLQRTVKLKSATTLIDDGDLIDHCKMSRIR